MGVGIIFSGVLYMLVLRCLVDLSHRESHLCRIYAASCHNNTLWHALWEIIDSLPNVFVFPLCVPLNKIIHCVCVSQYRLRSQDVPLFCRVFGRSKILSLKSGTSLLNIF